MDVIHNIVCFSLVGATFELHSQLYRFCSLFADDPFKYWTNDVIFVPREMGTHTCPSQRQQHQRFIICSWESTVTHIQIRIYIKEYFIFENKERYKIWRQSFSALTMAACSGHSVCASCNTAIRWKKEIKYEMNKQLLLLRIRLQLTPVKLRTIPNVDTIANALVVVVVYCFVFSQWQNNSNLEQTKKKNCMEIICANMLDIWNSRITRNSAGTSDIFTVTPSWHFLAFLIFNRKFETKIEYKFIN